MCTLTCQSSVLLAMQVLTAERSVSLAQLENDVTTLRDTNLRLEQRIEELQAELDGARRSYSKVEA